MGSELSSLKGLKPQRTGSSFTGCVFKLCPECRVLTYGFHPLAVLQGVHETSEIHQTWGSSSSSGGASRLEKASVAGAVLGQFTEAILSKHFWLADV